MGKKGSDKERTAIRLDNPEWTLEFIHRLLQDVDTKLLVTAYEASISATDSTAAQKLVTLSKVSSRVLGAEAVMSQDVSQRLMVAGPDFPSGLAAYLLMTAIEALSRFVIGTRKGHHFQDFFLQISDEDKASILSCIGSLEMDPNEFVMRTGEELELFRGDWKEVDQEKQLKRIADLLEKVYRHPFTHQADIYGMHRGPEWVDKFSPTDWRVTSFIRRDESGQEFYYQVSFAVEKDVLKELSTIIRNSVRAEVQLLLF